MGSLGFITYFAAQGINYRVPFLPPFETLDIRHLGTLMLDLARPHLWIPTASASAC